MNRRLSAVATAGGLSFALLLGCGLHRPAPKPAPGAVPESAVLPSAVPSAVPPSPINPVVTSCNITLPPVAPAEVTLAMATSGLPCALAFNGQITLESLQGAFDFNSWLTFVALNAPAAGGPIGPDAPTLWEGWQDLFSTMLPDGAPPPPFGQSVPPPAVCADDGGGQVLRMISKTVETPTVSVAGQPLRTGPLIDQNGHYARYQIVINRPMFDYVVTNRLYNKIGQRSFGGSVAFPIGEVTSGTTGTIGAIVVKAAWKVLDPEDPNDDPSRFHVVNARVYTPASTGVEESCRPATLGLVGLHIVHKTKDEPQWIWSTFEHVDNVPTKAQAATLPPGKHFNFFRSGCGAAECPPNQQPPLPWDPSVDPFPGNFHSQIVRATDYVPIAVSSAAHWNEQFRAVLGATVWKNYELITTQWPTLQGDPVHPDGQPFPLFAANTTMETYVQGNVPLASSSCMACHGNATDTQGKESDFSFVLEKAH